MRRVLSAIVVAGLVAGTAQAQDDDHYRAPRDADLDARGARVLRVEAKAGALRIEGREGISEVRVRGIARASRESWLDDIQLRTDRRGDALEVIVDIPSWSWSGGRHEYKGLDLVIEVPSTLALDVTDGSGEIEMRGVGAVRLRDGSGEIDMNDVGAVDIEDGSGEISLRTVRGDVRLQDGSGEVHIEDVRGNVDILDDGSGSLTIARITGWVQVQDAGSGSVRVTDVGGDLTVRDTRRSRVRYENVRGEVRIADR
jgi:DUF4097 and DUF4098 domain-containing protein YvlB